MSLLRRNGGLTAGSLSKVVLPILYTGAGLRLLATFQTSTDPAVREMAVALSAATAASSTLPASVLRTFDDILGDDNYARFLSQLGTAVAAGTGCGVLLRSAYPQDQAEPGVRSRRRRLIGTLLVMSALFAADRTVAAQLQAPTDRLYRPISVLYWTVFGSFMVSTTGEAALLSLRTARSSKDASLRTGLRCVAVGTTGLAAFYSQFVTTLTTRRVTKRGPEPLGGVPAQAIIGAAAALVVVGANIPGAAWRTRQLRDSAADLRLAAAVKPLWRSVHTHHPTASVVTGGLSPDVKLFRRVIEVLDGLDRLNTAYDPDGLLQDEARCLGQQLGLDESSVSALQRAALVQYALHHHAGGTANPLPQASAAAVPHGGAVAAAGFRAEAHELALASEYLIRSHLPGQLVSQHRANAKTKDL